MGAQAEIAKLQEGLSLAERRIVDAPGMAPRGAVTLDTGRPHWRLGVFSDPHIGHREFREQWWLDAIDHCESEGCDGILLAGDILEGMSGRPGHVYELHRIGYREQMALAVEMLGLSDLPWYAITGNHDAWYERQSDVGVIVGEDLEARLGKERFRFLGQHEGDLLINGIHVKLWHGQDGAAYALSYRAQKIVEALAGGTKPHVLILGHAHKSMAATIRNVRCIEAGTFSAQSSWMRYTRKESHPGYWILEAWGRDSLDRIREEWCPFYL